MKPIESIFLSAVLLSAAPAGAQYVAYDLGLGEAFAVSQGIVVGTADDGPNYAFMYQAGVVLTASAQ